MIRRCGPLLLLPLVLVSGCALIGRESGPFPAPSGEVAYTIECGTVETDVCRRLAAQNAADFERQHPGQPVAWVQLTEYPRITVVRVCNREPGTSVAGRLVCDSWDWERGPA